MTMTLHNYRSRQVHKTLNEVNPSRSFREMRSAESGPNLWQIWQVFGPWASPYGANGQMTMTVHNKRPKQFHRTSNGEKSVKRLQRYGFRKFGCRPPGRPPGHPLARPPTHPNRDNTPPARREGLRGKKVLIRGSCYLGCFFYAVTYSDNGLSPLRCRSAIIGTNDGLLSIEPLGEKSMKLDNVLAKWRLFCSGPNGVFSNSHDHSSKRSVWKLCL